MSNLRERIEKSRHAVDSKWSPERERLLAQRVARSLQRRAIARRVSGAGVAALVLAALGYFGARASGPVDEPGTLRFADGSVATPLSGESRLAIIDDAPDSSLVTLMAGGARFDVVSRPNRRFRVDAGVVQVEVLGTQFVVEHQEGKVFVSVERGHVRVHEGSAVTDLLAGERALFPRARETRAMTPAPPDTAELSPAPPAKQQNPAPAVSLRPPDWRVLAHQGEFERAYVARQRRSPAVRDGPQDLLLASDVARLSGHPAEAIEPLRELVARYGSDPRAPLAAFTLGRVLLDEVGRPREAAEAFRQVQGLEGAGQLTQDALARETEAWSRAGEPDLARERALEYLKRFPTGQRAQAVRRYGGID